MSYFHTSEPTTAFYLKLRCIQFSLHMLQMLTPVNIDADDANDGDDTDDADDYNRVIGIALLKAFSCAKNKRHQDVHIQGQGPLFCYFDC